MTGRCYNHWPIFSCGELYFVSLCRHGNSSCLNYCRELPASVRFRLLSICSIIWKRIISWRGAGEKLKMQNIRWWNCDTYFMKGICIFSVYFRMIIVINYFQTFRRTLSFYYSILYFESKYLCLFSVSAAESYWVLCSKGIHSL